MDTVASVRGASQQPLTGSPEPIVVQIKEMAAAGLSQWPLRGTTTTLGLRQYEEQPHPLLVDAGLRVAGAA